MAGFREKRNRTGKKPALRAVAPGVVMQYGVRLRRVASVPLAGDATACAAAGIADGLACQERGAYGEKAKVRPCLRPGFWRPCRLHDQVAGMVGSLSENAPPDGAYLE